LAVTGAKVFPSPDAAPLSNVTVLIHDGKIAAVGPNVAIPPGATKLTCDGCYVFAGFWNSHVHFTEPKWARAATEAAPVLTREVQEMLTHSGFTSVVDLGSYIVTTSALRRRIESGEVPGPRIFTAGSGLYPPNGVPYYLDDLPAAVRASLPQPSTPAEAGVIVKQNIAAGSDVLKLFTGSYVSRGHVKPMPLDVARAAVALAHANHQIAFAHPSNLEGVRIAMDSGVDVLAHAPDTVEGVDDRLLAELVAHHMSVVPTLKLFADESAIARIRAIVLRFHQLGGRLIFGTGICYRLRSDRRIPPARAGRPVFPRRACDAHHSARGTFWTKTRRPSRTGPARRSHDSFGRPCIARPDGLYPGALCDSRRPCDFRETLIRGALHRQLRHRLRRHRLLRESHRHQVRHSRLLHGHAI